MSTPHVIVVGAGFAGLAAAVRLADAGVRVSLVEATAHGGGRARSFAHPGFGRAIDNGQHLLMGCYQHTRAFLRTLGTEEHIWFQRNMEVAMVREGGHWSALRAPALPAPLHLGVGLLTMKGLGLRHKVAALRAGLLLSNEVKRPDDNETCDAWLRRMGQTQAVRAQFWEPLIWATLNDDPLVASSAMLMAVLERAFLSTRDASAMGVPRLPLSELYVPQSFERLRERGADLHLKAPMRELIVERDRVVGVRLRSGEKLRADTVVSAVPPPALLSALPDAATRHPVFQDVARLAFAPIVNLWVQVDRAPWDGAPFVGLVGSPMHWLFDRTRIEGHDGPGALLSVTISGARGFVDDAPEALIDLLAAELARFFPDRPVRIQGHKVIKEKRATISHAAGTYARRPGIQSPLPGLLLAGDWVRTGLPATIESACQSGHQAADLILRPQEVPWASA